MEQQLNAKIPIKPEFKGYTANANLDMPFEDYDGDDFTTAHGSYVVGTNQVNAHGDQRKVFVSKSTLIFCTVAGFVQFNSTRNVPTYILANTWYEFKSNIYSVAYYAEGQTAGKIYMYFEGTLSEETRSPE